jgi:hypothetical protein
MSTQPFLPMTDDAWIDVKDGDPSGRSLFRRHYSYKPYRDGRDPALFVGPGEKMVLLTPDAKGLFVWRKFISGNAQQGINCAVFRNEAAGLASDLIREADRLAWERWPGERHYTYVNPKRVRSRNPGYCFMKAGWRKCGVTKWKKLLIFEILPPTLDSDSSTNSTPHYK